ncbi:hypothetical protein V8G54_028050 [Vigna mungo]|uniref:Uncharacterized protein n=1 Tax=Vigna mungo TaxID=3915 RepID=A0AAQ3MS94_VIGMU
MACEILEQNVVLLFCGFCRSRASGKKIVAVSRCFGWHNEVVQLGFWFLKVSMEAQGRGRRERCCLWWLTWRRRIADLGLPLAIRKFYDCNEKENVVCEENWVMFLGYVAFVHRCRDGYVSCSGSVIKEKVMTIVRVLEVEDGR